MRKKTGAGPVRHRRLAAAGPGEVLESHSLVSGVALICEPRGDIGLRVEVGGLDFEVWVEPA
ncbi:hypothetical protein [Streptomyces chrestomyceticus]|uniref:hypothetical protein n=1 Tax=Streptomyces chrestomyceticus TaxID=68185 RepID=UPI0035A837F8